MATLLLRLAAPMQAWGDESKYEIRGTKTEPTKSGIIGILSAAMGFQRDSEEIQKMAEKLRVGIRVDQPGIVIRDFHTAWPPKYTKGGSLKLLKYEKDGTPVMDDSIYVTHRYYLCDACFLAGIECNETEYLLDIRQALQSPVFPIFLGRRACPPSLPIDLGIRDCSLETALKSEGWIASDWFKDRQGSMRARIITETPKGQTAWYTQMDQPVSFSPVHRKYTLRGINKEEYVILKVSEHDPMAAL